ncbi:hypothetical protein [Methylorubrum aminovorans]|uniref:hypothetical protein n=1 Tax=Methylorubrum aminovorans TaxID=269069 RepID=UPI0024E0980E|nr:hypothetical protein [Methylorubrum aminovorans]
MANFSISYQSPLLTTPPLTRATIGTNTAGFPDDRYRAVPAINVPYIQTRIDGVCIKNAMYGIRARGNCGAAYWTDLRIGAFTKGVETDGALDFITGSGWRFWPYGYDGLAETFYYDGQTVGWDCAQVESVAVTDLNFFGANMVVRAGELNPGTTPFGNVGSVSLDGNCSRIIMQGGRLNIGVLYSTKDSGQAGYGGKSADCFRSLVQTGGRLQIGLLDSVVNGGANDMEINGGTLEVLGGTHQQVSAGFRSLFVTGGYVRAAWTQQPNISAGTLVQQAVARPVEFAAATGTGVLNAQDMTFMPQRTGDSGNAIVFASDLPGSVAPLNAGGWGIAATNGIQNLQLGPTFAAGTTFSPTVNFVTPNGFVPVYVERHGRYWHTACGIEFTMRLVVNMNNVSVASGRLFITGLPALNGEATGRALTLGEWSGIAFDVPFTQLNAAYDDTRKALVLWECGRASGIAPSAGPIIATNFINNAIMVLNLSGSIAKR